MNLSNDVIIHKKVGNIEYLQFRRLLEYEDKINHCYTLKGEKNADYKEITAENYKEVLQSLGLREESLVKTYKQKHTDIVQRVNSIKDTPSFIDGLVSNKNGITLALTFADCTPIFMYDPVKNAVGDIHSGWRGTVQKIAQKGVEKMIHEFSSSASNLICCMGPCIGRCHFEVDVEVKDIFEKEFSYLQLGDEIIIKGRIVEGKQKYNIDTNKINVKLLEEIGVKRENILVSNICTVCNNQKIHSFRVEKEQYGLNTAMIGIRD